MRLFPGLSGQTYCRVDLEAESRFFREAHPELYPDPTRNPLLDPAVCQRFLEEIHHRREVDWSFGGHLENRPHLWQNSYLQASGNFVHLGVDFHVPQGTAVAVGRESQVMLLDDDAAPNGGWGLRVFLKPSMRLSPMTDSNPAATAGPGWGARPAGTPETEVFLIYAHLQNCRWRPGDRLQPGDVLAEVGGPPGNGNWAPHLHIQALRAASFQEILLEHFPDLDGYGPPARLSELAYRFPDPLPHLGCEEFPGAAEPQPN